jgi:hypothetical protein
MKKILFLFGLFTLLATVSFAQDRSKSRVKPAKTSGWRDDSLLWVKKPTTATVKSPSSNKGNQNQDKLGNFEIQDVKAPNPNEDKLGNFEIQSAKDPKTTVNAREAGSGQATGRRVHKPVRRKPGN